jgi:hypothetical protein
METNLDMFIDRDNRYVTDPARVPHQQRKCPLDFVAAMQGVSPGQEASHVAQTGIQRLS